MHKYVRPYIYSLLLILILLSGCHVGGKHNHDQYYLLFMGESESWNLNGYEVMMGSDHFKLGNGKLTMKEEKAYITDSFHFETHLVIANEDSIVHSGTSSGNGIDIAEEFTGSIDGSSLLHEGGEVVELGDIDQIYMLIRWWDPELEEKLEERIDLYDGLTQDDSFLK